MRKFLLVIWALVFCSVASFASTGEKDADKEMQASLSKGKQPELSSDDSSDEELSSETVDQEETGLESVMMRLRFEQSQEQKAQASTSQQPLQPMGTPSKNEGRSNTAPQSAPSKLGSRSDSKSEPISPSKFLQESSFLSTPEKRQITSGAPSTLPKTKEKPRREPTQHSSKKAQREREAEKEVIRSHRFTASSKFFSREKQEWSLNRKAAEELASFRRQYNEHAPTQRIDLTGFSSRVRVDLLKEIIALKREKLPTDGKENTFWRIVYLKPNDDKLVDRKPTIFTIGRFTYELELNLRNNQPGCGLLSISGRQIIPSKNIAEYPNGAKWIKEHLKDKGKNTIGYYINLLLIQRKYGDPIYTEDEQASCYFNFLNLLLDFEEARRRFEGDSWKDLPVTVHIEHMLKHLTEWEEELDRPGFKKMLHLFKSDYRYAAEEYFAEEVDLTDDYYQSEDDIRRGLENSHSTDEYSGDEYSGDEEPRLERVMRYLLRERDHFLETVADRYIQGMRYYNGNKMLWGGELELGIIARLANLRIMLYRYNPDHTIDHQLVPGTENGRTTINLWFGARHYQIVHHPVDNPQNTDELQLEDVPKDGNCLFNAVIKAANLTSKDSSPVLLRLRNLVANELEHHREDITNRVFSPT